MIYYSDSFTDYEGEAVAVSWTQEVWESHLNKHPEITSPEWASNLIKETLSSPSLVMDGKRDGDGEVRTRCYCKEHKRDGSYLYFTKVVTGCDRSPFYIKTVFVQWLFHGIVVQEKKYNNFKEVWRDPKTYL